MKTPSPRRSALASGRNNVTPRPTTGAITVFLVIPCGDVASCCWRWPMLNRNRLPATSLLLAKDKVAVHSCSVGLLASGLDGNGAGLLREYTTSEGLRPIEFPVRKVEVKTRPGVNLYLVGSRKSCGVMPLKLPPVGFPPVCGVPSGLKFSVLI